MPWLDAENEDDLSPLEHGQDEEGSEEERDNARTYPSHLPYCVSFQQPTDDRLTSSIHTIHRPVARSRRVAAPSNALRPFKEQATEDDSDGDGPDEEPEDEDFEDGAPKIPVTTTLHPAAQRAGPSVPRGVDPRASRIVPSRTGSTATVRLQRRTRLAEKLRDVFQLEGIEEVVAGMRFMTILLPC